MFPAFLRAVTATTLACTRCGSADVHPVVGAFGPLVGLLGFMRHGCRSCRRSFWIRTGADRRRASTPSDHPEPAGSAGAPPPRPAAASLDFEVTPAKHEKVDLTPLDAEFERIRTGGAAPRPAREELAPSPPAEERSPSPHKRRRRKRRP